jgi:uroporphyrin-III C-methyltransferase/precorrin-2 dehydrogenase/sirohydrochlorin ferrochelatase
VIGLVSLVGAGPGDPELLTRKAARRLSEADLVLYDALVVPSVLDLAPRAQRFFVGKRAARKAMRQETIHWLLIRSARRGRRVVRLKGGDPFVFGRGGEEALALEAAGVPFEVVPGISSAVAAPALAGIPVTHRGLASGFLVVTGHSERSHRSILGSVAPGSVTVVVLMGVAERASLARLLLDRGWDPRTPSAILLGASTPEARTWLGDLASLGRATLPEEAADAPGTIVIGGVVSVAQALGRIAGGRSHPAVAVSGALEPRNKGASHGSRG